MRKAFVAFSMLLLTASAANAGGLVTRHQSSLQHTVDPTRTITSRTANSYSISGSGVSLDLDADTTGNDLKVGGFNEFSNGAVSSWHIPTATISDGEAFSFTNSVITGDATNATGTNSTVYTAGAAGSYSGDATNQEPLIVDTGLLSQVLLKVLVQV